MDRAILLLVLAGCGHTVRTGAGPIVNHAGHPGLVASFEVGTHTISARQVAAPLGIRLEASATEDGVQALFGLAYGVNLPAGGRSRGATEASGARGWGARFAFAAGGLFDSAADIATGLRGGIALVRGSTRHEGRDGGGCLGSHEKSRMCFAWDRYRFSQTGLELGARFRLVDDDGRTHLDGWQLSAEFVHERGTLSDLGM